MEYQFKNLKKEDLPELYQTSVKAFSDYAVDMSYMTEENLNYRCIKNNVDFNKSVAVYFENKMVGYTLIGIDNWQGVKSAFDAGTGIIKEHRGKGLAGKMFEFAVPLLKDHGVKKFWLEVLQVNEKAIKAYQKTGFKITREFDCFRIKPPELVLSDKSKFKYCIKRIDKRDLLLSEDFMDWQPSWENSLMAINRIPNSVVSYGSFIGDELVGTFVYYPSLNWIMNISVKKEFRRKGIATELLHYFFNEFKSQNNYIKLINIDHRDDCMKSFIKKNGFEFTINQYEMALDL